MNIAKVTFLVAVTITIFFKVFQSGVRLLRFALPHNNCVVWGKYCLSKLNFLH